MRLLRWAATGVLLLLIWPPGASAQSIRDRIRLSPDKRTPITEEQANELTLTLNEAAARPLQVWIRTSGAIAASGTSPTPTATPGASDASGRSIPAALTRGDGAQVKAGQRVRAFPPESRSSMFQARVTG